MTPELTQKLLRYEECKLAIRELESTLEDLKPELIEAIPVDQEIKALSGTFCLKARPKWKYSIATLELEEELKDAKKREEADGTAEEIPGTPFIEYRTNK